MRRSSHGFAFVAVFALVFGAIAPMPTSAQPAVASDAPVAATPEPAATTPAPPPEVTLEPPRPSQGHYVGLMLAGVTAMAWDDDRGYRAPSFGVVGNLRLGQSVTRWLDLGIVFSFGQTFGDPARSLKYGGLRVQAQLYPVSRVFVRTGFGFLSAKGQDPNDDAFVRRSFGSVLELGIGAHLFLSDRNESGGWVLSPVFSAEVGPDPGLTTLTLALGLELSWWSGLRRDQLDLPIDRAYE